MLICHQEKQSHFNCCHGQWLECELSALVYFREKLNYFEVEKQEKIQTRLNTTPDQNFTSTNMISSILLYFTQFLCQLFLLSYAVIIKCKFTMKVCFNFYDLLNFFMKR